MCIGSMKFPHMLIAGGTGGGKTYFILTIIEALLCTNAELYVLDPKNADLADLSAVMPEAYYRKEEITECIDRYLKTSESFISFSESKSKSPLSTASVILLMKDTLEFAVPMLFICSLVNLSTFEGVILPSHKSTNLENILFLALTDSIYSMIS